MWYEKEGQKPMYIQDSNPKVIPLEEQLRQAEKEEDYETAVIIRDIINRRRLEKMTRRG
ncbi:MAG TPA: hypothetical protein VGD40_10100 [Chryseosolibacter sp.]